MKKAFLLFLSAFCLVFPALTACATGSHTPVSTQGATNPMHTNAPQEETADKMTDDLQKPVRILLTVEGKEAVVEMLDNDAAADFLSMLPLTLTFEDYNGIEKISNLPHALTLGSAPTNCDPDVGSFAYYAPWGNLSVFYQDFRQSNSLIPLGSFVSGIEIFAEKNEDFSVTIEREEPK